MPKWEATIASAWEEISKLAGLDRRSMQQLEHNSSTPPHDTTKEQAEIDEQQAELVNNLVFKSNPVSSKTSKPALRQYKIKRTGSAQERQATKKHRTRNATASAASTPAEESIQSSPATQKRTRFAEAQEVRPVKSPRIHKRVTATTSTSTEEIVQSSPHSIVESSTNAGPRGDGRQVALVVEPPSDEGALTEAAQSSPVVPNKRSSFETTVVVSSPSHTTGKPRGGGKLNRPIGLRRAAKSIPSKQGENVFDIDQEPNFMQERTLPVIRDEPSKRPVSRGKSNAKIRVNRAASATDNEAHAREGGSKEPIPKTGGRSAGGVEKYAVTEKSVASSSRLTRSGNGNVKQNSEVGLKKPTRTKELRKSALARIEKSDKFAESGTDTGSEYNEKGLADPDNDAASDEIEGGPPEAATAADGLDDESIIDDDAMLPAVLGQEDAWEKILEAVRENCPDPKQEKTGRSRAKFQSGKPLIQGLCKNAIRKASIKYKILRKGKLDDHAQGEAERELVTILDAIEMRINNVSEVDIENENNMRSKTITDIYLRGVPDMVYLLRAAMRHRYSEIDDAYTYKGILEVVRIQDMTIRLCRKAYAWKAAPITKSKSIRIVKPIRSVVFPYLRDNLRKAFDYEMRRLEVEDRKKQNRMKTEMNNEAYATPFSQTRVDTAEEEAERRTETLWQLEQEIRRNQQQFRAKLLGLQSAAYESRSLSSQPRYSSHQPEHHGAQWTRDEERELIIQLQKRHSRDLPADERYLKILNAPLLQNKLPEHIRKKALELRPFLTEVLPDAEYIRSIA